MLSHNYVCTHVSNSDMVTVATNRQHIVSMAYTCTRTHTHTLYKKNHRSDLMQVSSISVRVSYLMLFMDEYCAKSKASIIIMEVKRRNKTKQKKNAHTTAEEKDIEKDKLPSIHPSEEEKHHFCIHNFILYLCIILFM